MGKNILKKSTEAFKALSWEEFYKTPLNRKIKYFETNDRLFDILFSQQFNIRIINKLFNTANSIRKIAKTKEGLDWLQTLLSHKRAMLYFVQPSTRTFLSFQSACHILGMKVSEIRSTSTSSELKGESAEDTIRTFSSYADLIIMRHLEEGMAEKAAWMLNKTNRPISIINGGSGKDQHPTQALLDLYTIYLSFQDKDGINGKTIVMVGDLLRGRTVRSLTYLLKHFKGIKIIYVSPEYLRIGNDIKQFLKRHKIPFTETNNLIKSLKAADAVYMTRIQDEYDINNESKDIDYSKYHLRKNHLKYMKKDSIIMHPLPRRQEIDINVDNDKRAMFWRQERNGMWIRTAIIAYLFGIENQILKKQV